MADLEADVGVLRGGAPKIFDASDRIGDAAALVRGARVTAAALGEVGGAGEFSAAVAAFAETHGDDLVHGSMWVNDAGDGLLRTADEYERTESDNTAGLGGSRGDN